MINEGPQQMLLALQRAAVVAGDVSQREQIEARVVSQRIGFQITPGVFDWIQFRGVGRQEFGADGGRSKQFLDGNSNAAGLNLDPYQ